MRDNNQADKQIEKEKEEEEDEEEDKEENQEDQQHQQDEEDEDNFNISIIQNRASYSLRLPKHKHIVQRKIKGEQ
jgi:hypothetical protein